MKTDAYVIGLDAQNSLKYFGVDGPHSVFIHDHDPSNNVLNCINSLGNVVPYPRVDDSVIGSPKTYLFKITCKGTLLNK